MDTVQVKILLLKSGLSQTDIAHELGITQPAVNLILFGQRPGYKYQGRIARMLGVKISDLFRNTKPKRVKKPTRRSSTPKLKTQSESIAGERLN